MSRIAKLVVVVSVIGFGVGLVTLSLITRHRRAEQQRTARAAWEHMSQLERDVVRREAGEPPPDGEAPTLPEPDPALVYRISVDGSPQRGPVSAPLTIVVFGDFQSRDSRDADAAVRQVARDRNNEGKLRFAWKNLTVGRGARAEKAAILALVADDHGRFWSIHDDLLAGKADPLTDDKLIALGQQAGLSEQDIRAAWNDPLRRQRLADDRYQARRFGIHRGPALFVNGRFAKWPLAPAALAALVDDTMQLANIVMSSGKSPEQVYEKLMRGAIPNTAPLSGHQVSVAP